MPGTVGRDRVVLEDRGVEIALLDFGGDGPLAFLHHANGFCAALWAPVAERLRQHFHVVAMDARGHGDSSAPAWPEGYDWEHFHGDLIAVVLRVLERTRHRRVDLGIGHSFGGTTTAIAAARRPELFGRIAMLDPVLLPPGVRALMLETEGAAQRNLMSEQARSRRHVWPSPEAIVAAWSRPQHPFSAWRPEALEIYAHEGFRRLPDGSVELKCAGEVEAAVYDHNGSLDPFEYAPRIQAPTLIQWAKRGNFPREVYEGFAAEIPIARIEDIDGGHLLPMEVPDLVAESLLRFAGA
jgi:pimeloyl-ACP methyl ester carboxylesterase